MSHFIIASITLAKDANVHHLHRSWFCCCCCCCWSDNGSNRAVLAFVQQQPLPRVARAITTGKNRGSSKDILKLQPVFRHQTLQANGTQSIDSAVQCLLWRNEVLSRHTFSTLLVVVDLWAILKVESLLPTKPAKKATKKKYSFSIKKIINIRK